MFMAGSGTFLWLAQGEIPIGTAYAVWTSIGAAGTFIVGNLFFGDQASIFKYFAILLIVGGVAMLQLAP
ncbi:Membrane transporter of cations and cationic drugs [Candidatus Regiella insecticola 5.15]|uniref:Guanidinium exporter n=2 Tax=Candidatus Regiella insecticola TaxID=138073 RepID=G2H140_9ENTR|nr:Membrane transporter of cations and cationic drugs [Candidatus Regiella insecticola 5.15]